MAEAKAKADMENKEDATAAQDKAEGLQKEVNPASVGCLAAHTASSESNMSAGRVFRIVP